MKKFFLSFSLMVVSLAVVSCGSDEDEPNYANQTMVVVTPTTSQAKSRIGLRTTISSLVYPMVS